MAVVASGKVLAPLLNGGEVEGCGKDFDGVPSVSQDFAFGIDDERLAWEVEVGIGTDTIDADDIGLVLDGTRFEQSDPVLNTRRGPVGEDDEKLGGGSGEAKNFGEAEVVTDEGSESPIAEGHRSHP